MGEEALADVMWPRAESSRGRVQLTRFTCMGVREGVLSGAVGTLQQTTREDAFVSVRKESDT